MYTNVIGYWNGRKDKLRQQFPILTSEDLDFYPGKEKEMLEFIEHKLGKSKEELRKIIIAL